MKANKKPDKQSKTPTTKPTSTKRRASDSLNGLEPLPAPELFFGFVAPSGTNLDLITEPLRTELQKVGYAVEQIDLSKCIESFVGNDYSTLHHDERIQELMRQGTNIRETSNFGDAIAFLAILEILRIRRTKHDGIASKIAYFLKSLKHPDEIVTLRKIYGRGFYCISVYTPRAERVTSLAAKIAKSNHKQQGSRAKAEELIETDELERGKRLGQDVKDAFPLADFFIDGRAKQKISAEIRRFVEILLSYPYHTPTKDEYGMYHAKSAALRSADLGRQVGASITTSDCDLVAVGCNDVPKFGGGLYWSDDEMDGRDFRKGIDPISEQKEQMIGEIFERLRENKWLSDDKKNQDPKDLLTSIFSGKQKQVFSGTHIMSLLEFGRSVHAEMAALMDASRRGVSVKGATLFTTTFPCHLCAKHIVASGIERVVYIEPYPKSKALQLYEDSIAVDESQRIKGKVCFEPFVGIAPRQYLDLFEAIGERKDISGKIIKWPESGVRPRFNRYLNTYLMLEYNVVADIIPKIAEALNIDILN